MAWNVETHTITSSSDALPEIIGRGPRGIEYREQMLTTRSNSGREAVGELFEYTVVAEVGNPDFLLDPDSAAQIDLERIVGRLGTVAIEIAGIGTYCAG